MEKEIYLIRGFANESYQTFGERIFATAERTITELQPAALSLTLTEKAPPRISVIPFGRSKISAISIYRERGQPVQRFINMEGFAGGYRTTEAFPVAYDRNWEDEQVTPGICLLTLFRKKKQIDYSTFLDRWHNGHTPLSLRLHPLWHYNRNVVDTRLTEHSTPYDGIVEEHCRTRSELLNPFKFFGHPITMLYHMLEVYFDVRSFLDYSSIEPYLVQEYHLSSKKDG